MKTLTISRLFVAESERSCRAGNRGV